MAFTKETIAVQRFNHFGFFNDGSTSINESFAPGFDFELAEIKLHLSTAHVSAVDLKVWVGHHLGSMYNVLLISRGMLGVQTYEFTPDYAQKIFHRLDTINVSMLLSSVNTYGLEINGWSVTQENQ